MAVEGGDGDDNLFVAGSVFDGRSRSFFDGCRVKQGDLWLPAFIRSLNDVMEANPSLCKPKTHTQNELKLFLNPLI